MNDDQLDDLLRDAARTYNAPPAPPRDQMWDFIESARRANAVRPLPGSAAARWLRPAAGMAAVLLLGIAIGRGTRSGDGTAAPRPAATTRGAAPAASSAPIASVAPTSSTVPTAAQRAASGSTGEESIAGATTRDGSTDGGVGTSHGGARSALAAGVAVPRRDAAGSTYGVPRHTPGLVGEGTAMNASRLAVVEHLARTEVMLTGFRSTAGAGERASRTDAEQFGTLSRELLQNTRLLLATHATDDPALTRLLQDLELVLMQIAQYAADGGARHGDLDAINQSLDRRNVLPKLRSTIPAGAPAPAGT